MRIASERPERKATLKTQSPPPFACAVCGVPAQTPYSQKIRPRRCPDPEIIAPRMLMINQAQEVFGRFPASLIYVC
jgi:hypothetical protein